MALNNIESLTYFKNKIKFNAVLGVPETFQLQKVKQLGQKSSDL